MFHCPGSPFYENPSEHYLYKYLGNDEPIKKTTMPHRFIRFGLCHCENVEEIELVEDENRADPRPGKLHMRCWQWRLEQPST